MILRTLFSATLALAALCCFAQDKVVLGRLGHASTTLRVHPRASSRSGTLCRVKSGADIIVADQGDPWDRILLKDKFGQTFYGYVQASGVKLMEFQVVGKQTAASPMAARGFLASRGGGSTTPAAAALVAESALQYQGVPYKWGGADLSNGVDCSGFVKDMFGQIGLSLPRTAAEQALVGEPITRLEYLRAGDRLYFWDGKRHMIGHTGIYLGNGYFVHSSTNHRGVATDYLGTQKWLRILVAARRDSRSGR